MEEDCVDEDSFKRAYRRKLHREVNNKLFKFPSFCSLALNVYEKLKNFAFTSGNALTTSNELVTL